MAIEQKQTIEERISLQRPYPNARTFIAMCGGNQEFISCFHHGLVETPIRFLYPYLNLEELFVFESSSWKSRQMKTLKQETINSDSIYHVFYEINKIGFKWLNKYFNRENISEKAYKQLNPYKDVQRDLEKRLNAAQAATSPEWISTFRKNLSEDVNEYVFHCQYQERKMARGGDNYKLEKMHFQNVYPSHGAKHVAAFARECARIMKTYPNNLIYVEDKSAEKLTEKKENSQENAITSLVQGTLF